MEFRAISGANLGSADFPMPQDPLASPRHSPRHSPRAASPTPQVTAGRLRDNEVPMNGMPIQTPPNGNLKKQGSVTSRHHRVRYEETTPPHHFHDENLPTLDQEAIMKKIRMYKSRAEERSHAGTSADAVSKRNGVGRHEMPGSRMDGTTIQNLHTSTFTPQQLFNPQQLMSDADESLSAIVRTSMVLPNTDHARADRFAQNTRTEFSSRPPNAHQTARTFSPRNGTSAGEAPIQRVTRRRSWEEQDGDGMRRPEADTNTRFMKKKFSVRTTTMSLNSKNRQERKLLEIGDKLAAMKDEAQQIKKIHTYNFKMQHEEEIWTTLTELDEEHDSTEQYETKLGRIKSLVKENPEYRGHVGDSPLHQAFLLAKHATGKRIFEIMVADNDTPERRRKLVSEPYANDIQAFYTAFAKKWPDHALSVAHRYNNEGDGGMFTGETLLHISIVHNNISSVSWLLTQGASLWVEATGVFFKPHRIKRTNGDDWYLSKYKKNEDSAVYYGGFPFSFAVCLGSIEICEMLMEHAVRVIRGMQKDDVYEQLKRGLSASVEMQVSQVIKLEYIDKKKDRSDIHLDGEYMRLKEESDQLNDLCRVVRRYDVYGQSPTSGNPKLDSQSLNVANYLGKLFINAQDVHGNTALHMAVERKSIQLIDWLMANGAKGSMDLLNENHLTPLTLAVRLGYVDIYRHILDEHMTIIPWIYGNVSMRYTSLEQVDTFRIQGKPLHQGKWRSCLEVAIRHEVPEFAADQLMHKLIQEKWTKFAKRFHILYVVTPYLLLLCLFTASTLTRCGDIQVIVAEEEKGGQSIQEAAHKALSAIEWASLLLVPFLLGRAWMDKRIRMSDLDTNQDTEISTSELIMFLYKNNEPMVNLIVALMLITSVILRGVGLFNLELDCISLSAILLWCNVLNLLKPFKFFGMLLISIHHMLVGDVATFLSVYGIILCGFSQAGFVLLQNSRHQRYQEEGQSCPKCDEWWGHMILQDVWVSLGEVEITDLIDDSRTPFLMLLVQMIWMIMSAVLLLNLLIALMGHTFSNDRAEGHKVWFHSFAALVLRYEDRLLDRDKTRYRCGHPRPVDDEDDLKIQASVRFYDMSINKPSEPVPKVVSMERVESQPFAKRADSDSLRSCTT